MSEDKAKPAERDWAIERVAALTEMNRELEATNSGLREQLRDAKDEAARWESAYMGIRRELVDLRDRMRQMDIEQ